ncbi:hypothetical protein [Clostridium botulinum]|uniref:Uncharacterized protein n=1 Tax=Clostridium botulinum B2 450 TaxID=1379739 RepID=A0A0D0ZSF8_CLOBO|nr:hypothetical protein [Clostridium botulinum]KIS21773.1 hypothetical protein N495_20515 [Clostridium botulinum B2 450]
MKFYEFNDFGYYALIGANTKEEAIKYYEKTVCDIADNDGEPMELTKDEALERVMNAMNGELSKSDIEKDIEESINGKQPFLALIDECLI